MVHSHQSPRTNDPPTAVIGNEGRYSSGSTTTRVLALVQLGCLVHAV